MNRTLVLAALAALTSGCWSGVSVVKDGCVVRTVDVGDLSCVSCEYEITESNAVVRVAFIKDPGR